jgi:hypothetical protein
VFDFFMIASAGKGVYLLFEFPFQDLKVLSRMPPANPDAGHVSVVHLVQRGDPPERSKAVDHIVAAHWKPLYKYLRLQYQIPHAEAWTMTLNFLALFQERTFFAKFDPTRLPLREFIRQKLDVFVPTPGARKAVAPSPAFDFSGAEEEFQADQTGRGQSAPEYFCLFMKHDLQDRSGNERVGLEEIASELSMPLADALTSLAKTRQRFQSILMDLIRSFTSSDAEFQREARAFFRA